MPQSLNMNMAEYDNPWGGTVAQWLALERRVSVKVKKKPLNVHQEA